MSSEELDVNGPEQQQLLKNMDQAFRHNLKITAKQFEVAQRGLVEE